MVDNGKGFFEVSGSLRDALMKAGLAAPDLRTRKSRVGESKENADKDRHLGGGSQKRRSCRSSRSSKPSPSHIPASFSASRRDAKPPLPTGEGEDEIRQRRNAEIRRILDEQAERPDAKAETIPFHFIRHGRIKRIHLSPEQRGRLLRGELVVVGFRRSNHLLPRAAGERILSLRPEVSVFIVDESEDEPASDDGYEAFKVPEDLIW